MTEYNYFCYSKSLNDKDSFQQERWRMFNKVVGEKRYNELKEIISKILPKQSTLFLADYWKSVTQDQWKQLLAIPEAFDFKEGFEYISGCKIKDVVIPSLVGQVVTVTIGDNTYKAQIID